MSDEIELKLAVAPEHVAQLKKHPALRALKLRRSSIKRLVSTYYDTSGLALHGKAVALRVRQIGHERIQTIKQAAASRDRLTRREWEQRIASDGPDLSGIEDPELRRLIEPHRRGGALKPVFVTDVTRQTWPLRLGGSEIECVLDVGEIKAKGKTAPVCEVELGLKSGTSAKLFELARRLNRTVPLRVEHASKAERGYGLVTGAASGPRKAESVRLDPAMTVRDAFAVIARTCVAHILANVQSAHIGTNPEGLHQLRVGLRRLRAAFSLFRAAIPETDRASIGEELRWLQRELGPAREWDVFINSTMKIVDKRLKGGAGLVILLDAAEAERARGYERARAAIGGRRYTDLLLRLEAWLERLLQNGGRDGPDAQQDAGAKHVLDQPVRNFAASVLSTRHAKAQKLGARGRKINDDQLHELRIRVKKQRYATEFFRDLYTEKTAKRYAASLKELQEVLGTAHDALVADDLIPRLEAITAPGAERALGQLQGWCAAQVKHDRKRIEQLWANFERLKPFWKGAAR